MEENNIINTEENNTVNAEELHELLQIRRDKLAALSGCRKKPVRHCKIRPNRFQHGHKGKLQGI